MIATKLTIYRALLGLFDTPPTVRRVVKKIVIGILFAFLMTIND